MARVDTIKIAQGDGTYAIINKSDYQGGIHKPYQPPVKKKPATNTKSSGKDND